LEQAGLHRGVLEEAALLGDVRVAELEEDVGGFPVGEEGFGFVELGLSALGGDEIEKGLRFRAFEVEGAVALVAQGFK
jgi:hypothetical protein